MQSFIFGHELLIFLSYLPSPEITGMSHQAWPLESFRSYILKSFIQFIGCKEELSVRYYRAY